VALVDVNQAERFATAVAGTYQNATGRKPSIYVCQATNGAEVISAG
jgi:galactokinase